MAEALLRKLEIFIPKKLYDELEAVERKTGVRKEDILMRALIKVIEELGE